MGFYDKWVLPWLVDVAMRNKEATRYREKIVPEASGIVLEVGVGSGLNLPFYGAQVERYYGLDPSEELLTMAKKKAGGKSFPIDFLAHSGEEIPLDEAAVDTVVMTWTLCSISDPGRALADMKRVLRPGGTLLFAEHGLAPEPRVRAWQHRLNPLWRRITGGCNLDRRMDALVAGAGFEVLSLETGYAKGPRPMAFIYCGRARPAKSSAMAPSLR